MNRHLANYLEALLNVRVRSIDLRVMDAVNGALAAEIVVTTQDTFIPQASRFGSLLVRRVEHNMKDVFVIGEAQQKVPNGSEVVLSPVYGQETSEMFLALAKQFGWKEPKTASAPAVPAAPDPPYTARSDGPVTDRRTVERQPDGSIFFRDQVKNAAYCPSTGNRVR